MSRKSTFVKLTSLIPVIFLGAFLIIQHQNDKAKTILSPLEEFVQNTVLTADNSSKLEEIVQEELQNTDGTYAVAIKNLRTHEEYYYNKDRSFPSASLYKLWYMAETYHQIEEGKLTKTQTLSRSAQELNEIFDIDDEYAEVTDGYVTYSVEDALEKMITVSNNYAAHLLGVTLGISNVKEFIQEYNLSNTKIGTNPPITTANDVLTFYEKLHNKEVVSTSASEDMLELLKRQQLNDRIPKYLPEGTVVAHKTGELGAVKHDAGIVYSSNGDYIIVLLSETSSQTTAAEIEAKISEKVYNYFQNRD